MAPFVRYDVLSRFVLMEVDYRRNSIAGLAQKNFSTKALHGLHGGQMIEKLIKEKNIDWNEMPGWYKWGAFVKLQKYETLVWVKGRKGEGVCRMFRIVP